MRVLIVKTTSMGDVVHAVPVVEDIKRFISDAEIDWLVEDSFADIPRHVAGVSEVIECSVRKWKKRIFEKSTRGQIKALCEKLRSKHYDLVIDLQGLIKSAVLASWTNAPVAGYDRRSGKEPLATVLYSIKSSVDRQKSAVDRCRELAAKSLGYDFGSTKPQFNFKFEGSPESVGCVFFFCNTSRETKLWPEEKWIELGAELIRRGKRSSFHGVLRKKETGFCASKQDSAPEPRFPIVCRSDSSWKRFLRPMPSLVWIPV